MEGDDPSLSRRRLEPADSRDAGDGAGGSRPDFAAVDDPVDRRRDPGADRIRGIDGDVEGASAGGDHAPAARSDDPVATVVAVADRVATRNIQDASACPPSTHGCGWRYAGRAARAGRLCAGAVVRADFPRWL